MVGFPCEGAHGRRRGRRSHRFVYERMGPWYLADEQLFSFHGTPCRIFTQLPRQASAPPSCSPRRPVQQTPLCQGVRGLRTCWRPRSHASKTIWPCTDGRCSSVVCRAMAARSGLARDTNDGCDYQWYGQLRRPSQGPRHGPHRETGASYNTSSDYNSFQITPE